MPRLRCLQNYAGYDAGDEYLIDHAEEATRLLATGLFEEVAASEPLAESEAVESPKPKLSRRGS